MVCSCCSSRMSVNISGQRRVLALVAITTLGTGVSLWAVFFSPLSATLFPVETPSPATTRNDTAEITLVNATSEAGENSTVFHTEDSLLTEILERTAAVPAKKAKKAPLRWNKPAKKNVLSDQPVW